MLEEITADPDPQIPQGMLSDAAFNFADRERQMRSYFWWPKHIAVPGGSFSSAERVAGTRRLRHGDSVVDFAFRVDLSEPVPLNLLEGVTQAAPCMSPPDAGIKAASNLERNETSDELLL